jgi:hypothetical protein
VDIGVIEDAIIDKLCGVLAEGTATGEVNWAAAAYFTHDAPEFWLRFDANIVWCLKVGGYPNYDSFRFTMHQREPQRFHEFTVSFGDPKPNSQPGHAALTEAVRAHLVPRILEFPEDAFILELRKRRS